jgi:ribosomal-protein-alanine N-acetyltransferase
VTEGGTQVEIPTVTTERLVLRCFTENDAEPLHAILREPGILQYFPNPNSPPLEGVQRLIAHHIKEWSERGYSWWGVTPRDGGPVIGWSGLGYLPETDETEVAYLLAKPHWGRGLATEAARASLEWGYANKAFDRIIGLTHIDNVASQNVLLKLGMEYEGDYPYFGMTLRRYSTTRSRFLERRAAGP